MLTVRLLSLFCCFGILVGCSTQEVQLIQPEEIPTADSAPQFASTPSGLKYKMLREGTGGKPHATNSVTVHYRGWLDDGTEFDSSYKRGEPISFRLDQVIPGWTEGMQLVEKGGMIELEIPAELGYGARGAGGAIPPNARLHFVVELIDIN